MKSLNVKTVDIPEFVSSLSKVSADTARGSAFVVEAMKYMKNRELNHKTINYVVESAKHVDTDNALQNWVKRWSINTGQLNFKIGLVCESLSESGDSVVTKKLEELHDMDDEKAALEEIALKRTLHPHQTKQEVYDIIKEANEQVFDDSANKYNKAISVSNPIGFAITEGHMTIASFDGFIFQTDNNTEDISIYAGTNPEILQLAKVVSQASKNYKSNIDAFEFDTPIGAISVSPDGTFLAGSEMSIESIKAIAGDYYGVNKFSQEKAKDIRQLDTILAMLKPLAENYDKLSLFENVMKTATGDYLIMLENSYFIARKNVDVSSGSFSTSLQRFDKISDAIANLTDAEVKAELSKFYADEIANENADEIATQEKIEELNEELSKLDELDTKIETAKTELGDEIDEEIQDEFDETQKQIADKKEMINEELTRLKQ